MKRETHKVWAAVMAVVAALSLLMGSRGVALLALVAFLVHMYKLGTNQDRPSLDFGGKSDVERQAAADVEAVAVEEAVVKVIAGLVIALSLWLAYKGLTSPSPMAALPGLACAAGTTYLLSRRPHRPSWWALWGAGLLALVVLATLLAVSTVPEWAVVPALGCVAYYRLWRRYSPAAPDGSTADPRVQKSAEE